MQIIITPEELRAYEQRLFRWANDREQARYNAVRAVDLNTDPAKRTNIERDVVSFVALDEFEKANPQPKLLPHV